MSDSRAAIVSSAFVLLMLAICISSLSGTAWAQSATAGILGQVTDPQGAAIPGVAITVTNVATGVASRTNSDGNGNYRVLDLPIGTYVVSAEHAGFARMQTDKVTLQINQQSRVNLQMVIGAVSQTVEVSGVATTVETVNPTLGESVTSRPIVDMPLNGRNVLTLALLQPGVTEDNPDDNFGQGIAGILGFSVGGGRSDSVTYLLDGGANNDLLGNEVVYNPNPDSVAEFRILTSNYTAEYGRNGAGVISVVTKSGTNEIHGSAYDYVRNTDFDANSYFNIQEGLPRNDLKRNQYGGTIGGPILKNRLFFFVSYQGQRQVQTDVESQITTFTPAELQGNFSQANNGAPDPDVAAFLQTNTYFQSNPTKAAQAIIDPTKIDPVAMNYIATGLIPTTTSPNGTISSAAAAQDNRDELTGKLDFNITEKDKISATVGGSRNPQIEPFGLNDQYGATVSGFASSAQLNTYFGNVAYTRTISPALLNEVRVTAQRHYSLESKPIPSLPTPADLGFGITPDLPNGPPLMSFDNNLAFGTDEAGPAYETGNTYAVTEALTWLRGRNTWKFGAGFSAYQNNTLYDFFGDGSFTFIGPYADGGIGSGNSLADFLLGMPSSLFEGPNAANNIRSKATYGFGQDEWRVTKNLTLTLGLRYEYSTPKLDTQGRSFSIVPGEQSTRFPNAPLGLVFPGDAGAPRGVNFPDKDNFAPRVGFAWDPHGDGKTSFRGGFGIFYDVLKGEDNLQFNGAPPFYSENGPFFNCLPSPNDTACTNAPLLAGATSGTGYYSQPWTTGGFAQSPFPSTPPTANVDFVNAGFLPYNLNGGLYSVDPHLHTPYSYQYNLSMQHQLGDKTILEISYVGSDSKGLTALQDVNPFILGTSNRMLNLAPQSAEITNFCAPSGSFSAADCPFATALEFRNAGFASFNSLEASVTKQTSDNRYIGTTYMTIGYTYGHSIDNASGFRNRDSQVPYYDPMALRSSSDFDLRQRFTFSGGWDLPFDQAWSNGPKRLVKGWSLYPIFSWRTGFPLSINAQYTLDPSLPGPSGAGDGNLANAVFAPGFNSIPLLNAHTATTINGATGNYYFNPNAFLCGAGACVPSSGYGLPRDFFRGPGRVNLDMTLSKTTAITERVSLELRLDAFNVFNHPEFANPDTTASSQTFGQVTTTDLGTGVATLHTERILQLAGRVTF